MDESKAASRWFDAVGVCEQLPVARGLGAVVGDLVLGALTLGFLGGNIEVDSKRRCEVRVLRRDNQQVVSRYEYDRLQGATRHLADLRERLSSSLVFDFCRDLGIDTSEVVGPGIESDASQTDPWSEVPEGSLPSVKY